MRILIASSYYPPNSLGGAEVVAHRQAVLLRAAGHQVRVLAGRIAVGGTNERDRTEDTVDGVPVARIPVPKVEPDSDFRSEACEQAMLGLIREFRPDVVHFHNVAGLGANLIPAARAHVPVVVMTLHDNWGYCVRNMLLRPDLSLCTDFEECHRCQQTITSSEGRLPIRLRRDYIMTCLGAVDAFIAPSRGIKENYERAGIPAQRISILSNRIDAASITPRVRDPGGFTRFICATYLGEHKGIRELCLALKVLSSDASLAGKWEFQLAGGGHMEQHVRQAIGELGEGSPVKFLGALERREVLRRVGDSDVVMQTSIWPENEPVSILEGIASGAAVLASRIGGNVDLVKNEVNGLLYEPRDPDDLARAMRRFILTPGLVQDFSAANVSMRPTLDESEMAGSLTEIYTTAKASRTDRRRGDQSDFVVCGVLPPRWRTIAIVEREPAFVDERRVRYLWWRWCDDDQVRAAKKSWIWRVNPRALLGLLRRGSAVSRWRGPTLP